MATISFDKDLTIREPEAIEKLIEILSLNEARPINKKLISERELERGEKLLKQCLSNSKVFRNGF